MLASTSHLRATPSQMVTPFAPTSTRWPDGYSYSNRVFKRSNGVFLIARWVLVFFRFFISPSLPRSVLGAFSFPHVPYKCHNRRLSVFPPDNNGPQAIVFPKTVHHLDHSSPPGLGGLSPTLRGFISAPSRTTGTDHLGTYGINSVGTSRRNKFPPLQRGTVFATNTCGGTYKPTT